MLRGACRRDASGSRSDRAPVVCECGEQTRKVGVNHNAVQPIGLAVAAEPRVNFALSLIFCIAHELGGNFPVQIDWFVRHGAAASRSCAV
jgi:hypothetical protein